MVWSLFFASGYVSASLPAEGPKDLIEKAQNLVLQKDRTQATHILVSAMRREPAGSSPFREMKAALQDISNIFFNERAQQAYELALSLRRTDSKQAQAKLQEAARLEPDNLQIINEQARLQIILNNCDNGLEILNNIRKMNPFDEQTLLTSAQAAVCLKDWPLFTTLRSQSEGRKGPFKKAWLALEVERADQEKAESRAREAYLTLRNAFPDHPEVSYWEWRFSNTEKQKTLAGSKYILFCKNPSTASVRRYLSEPFLCRHVLEIETNTKAGGAP